MIDLSPDLQRRVENAYRNTDGLQEGAPPFDKLTPLARKRFEDKALMWFAPLVPELAAITPQYWLAPVEPTEGMVEALASDLYDEMERLDPSIEERAWADLRPRDRAVYRLSVAHVFRRFQAHMKEQEKE